MQNLKKKTDKNPLNSMSMVYFLKACLFIETFSQTNARYPSRYFSRMGTMS